MSAISRRDFAAGLGGITLAFTLAPRLGLCAAAREAARQPRRQPPARRLDSHRHRRQCHCLYRQGRTRPGHRDRIGADRGGGTRPAARPGTDDFGRHREDAERRRDRRQPVDREQRHGAAACRRAGPRDPARACGKTPRRRCRCAQRGRGGRRRAGRAQARLWRACRRGRSASRGDRAGAAEARLGAPDRRQVDRAARHTGKGHGRRSPLCRTCGCPECCTAGSCDLRAMERSSKDSTRRRPGQRRARSRRCATAASSARLPSAKCFTAGPVQLSASGTKHEELNEARIKAMPGVVAVVRDGSFLGVIAEREEQAIKASLALAESARWTAGAAAPG